MAHTPAHTKKPETHFSMQKKKLVVLAIYIYGAYRGAHQIDAKEKHDVLAIYIYGAYRGAHQKIRFRCRFGVSEVSAHTTQVASTMAGQSLGLGLGRASTGSRRWPASRLDWASGGPVWRVRSGQIPGQIHMSR